MIKSTQIEDKITMHLSKLKKRYVTTFRQNVIALNEKYTWQANCLHQIASLVHNLVQQNQRKSNEIKKLLTDSGLSPNEETCQQLQNHFSELEKGGLQTLDQIKRLVLSG